MANGTWRSSGGGGPTLVDSVEVLVAGQYMTFDLPADGVGSYLFVLDVRLGAAAGATKFFPEPNSSSANVALTGWFSNGGGITQDGGDRMVQADSAERASIWIGFEGSADVARRSGWYHGDGPNGGHYVFQGGFNWNSTDTLTTFRVAANTATGFGAGSKGWCWNMRGS